MSELSLDGFFVVDKRENVLTGLKITDQYIIFYNETDWLIVTDFTSVFYSGVAYLKFQPNISLILFD